MERVPLMPLSSSPQQKQFRQLPLAELFKRQQQTTSPSSPYHSENDSIRVRLSDELDGPVKKRRKPNATAFCLSQTQDLRVRAKTARHRKASSLQDVLDFTCLDPRSSIRVRNTLQSSIMGSFASHDVRDVYRCLALSDTRHFSVPFALSASHMAKRGEKQLVMAGTDEGCLTILDIGQPSHTPVNSGYQAHRNAIFDVKWSHDDRRVATASGDQSISVVDVESQKTCGKLVGHLGTVKQLQWDPVCPGLIATAARDGSIRIWDTRCPDPLPDEDDTELRCDNHLANLILNAHGDRVVSAPKQRTAVKSVTSVVYMEHRADLLASSGSFSSVVKVWDLRKSTMRRINPVPLFTSPDFSFQSCVSKKRSGIASMLLSADKSELYAVSTNSQLVALDALDVSRPEPLKRFTPTPWHEREAWQNSGIRSFNTNSFYLKLAVSTDGQILAAGTTNGSIWLWNTQQPDSGDVYLSGHSRDVCGLDFTRDALVSCSDDAYVRAWRPDAHTYNQFLTQDPAAMEAVRDYHAGIFG